jgi:hypothetical protein
MMLYICYVNNDKQTHNDMTTILSTSGKKAVKISQDASGMFRAAHVQLSIVFGEPIEDLIELKSYKTQKAAEKFAAQVLS